MCPLQIYARSAGLLLMVFSAFSMHSQSLPGIEKTADRMAIAVKNTGARQILIAPQEGCLLDPSLCEQFESHVRSAIERFNQGAQFIGRDHLLASVKSHGLISLDAYDKQVLVNLASEAGADTLVEENLCWEADHYELRTYLYAAQTGQAKKRIVTRVAPSVSGDDPLLYRDEEGDAYIIVAKRRTNGFRVFRDPQCAFCPMPGQWKPSGPFESVALLMTISNEGQIQDVVVIKSSSQKATEQTLQAVEKWRFKPAVDSDGQPFSARIRVTVDLTAPLCPATLPEKGDPPRVHIGPPLAFQPCPVLPSYYPQTHP